MKFRNQEDLDNFLSDKMYYAGKDNYCLGDNLEEAGAVIREIVNDAQEGGIDVGVDN